jgi:hypothetical protein
LIYCGILFLEHPAKADSSDSVLEVLARLESSYAKVNDYIAIFRKQERVRGTLLPEKTFFFKFQKPMKVYMKWIENPPKETEALYVEGGYDNKVIVHHAGIPGFRTLSLDPNGMIAMRNNRHPITELGFGFLIEGLRHNLQAALCNGELQITKLGDEWFQGRPATILEVRACPRDGRQYYASHMICHIDKELSLPVEVSFFDEREELFEKYSYTDVKLNVGLTEKDFSRYNEEYRFSCPR